jgi:hypothetical protein
VGLISAVQLDGSQATSIQTFRIANATPWAAVHLWGLAFGNGDLNQPRNCAFDVRFVVMGKVADRTATVMYFSAAMDPEVNGVLGRTWNVVCP